MVRRRSQWFAVVRPLLKTLKKRQSLTKISNLILLKNKNFAQKTVFAAILVIGPYFAQK